MTTTVAPDPKPDHPETEARATHQETNARSFDATQGRRIGDDRYDDPTQGRRLGSQSDDDPTQGRQLGSQPDDDPTQGRRLGSQPDDDPTQGRQPGSQPDDDPTQGRKLGSDPYDDPTQGRKLGADRLELTAAASQAPALARNRAFAAAGGHKNAVVFPRLGLFVITCLDPRVDPARFLGLELGDAIVMRNVGGRVTPEVINDIAFIAQIAENVMPDGPLFEVAVIHHTQCGTAALADGTFRRRYAQRIDAEEERLLKHAVLDPAATVTHDVEHLRAAPALSSRVTVSGHVYDVTTGLVQTILPSRTLSVSAPTQTSIHTPKRTT